MTSVGNAKACEMLSCLVGLTKYYRITGDTAYWSALHTAWLDIRSRRMYMRGTNSEHEYFVAGRHLPAEEANHMGEGCVSTTWMQWNMELYALSGDPMYVDEIERTLFNHVMAAENPKSGCVSYYTPLQGVKEHLCNQGYSCCLSSIPRALSWAPYVCLGRQSGMPVFNILESGNYIEIVPQTIRSNFKYRETVTGAIPSLYDCESLGGTWAH